MSFSSIWLTDQLHARADCPQPRPHRADASDPATPMPPGLVLGLTGVFMVLEAIGGWLSGSLALLADAGHMLTDVGALALSLLTAWVAQRPADDTKTYGYLRWEILAALVNGAALFRIAGWVVVEAIQRIQHPEPIRTGLFLAVAAGGPGRKPAEPRLLHGARDGQPQRPRRLPPRHGRRPGLGRRARRRRRSSGSPAGRWPTRSSRSRSRC